MNATAEEFDAEPVRVMYVTAPNVETARTIARTVVEERLAACVNIVPGVISIYEWQGALNEEEECCLILKMRASSEQALRERILALHPYEIPALVSWPLSSGHPAFLAWVRAQTAESQGP